MNDKAIAPDFTPPPEFLTTAEVGKMFGRTTVTIRTWVHQGKLDFVMINGRMLITRESVKRLANYNFGGKR